jgi:hypothetical protein
VLLVGQAVIMSYYISTMSACYNILIALVRRVSPFHILASESLPEYPLNKKTVNESTWVRMAA